MLTLIDIAKISRKFKMNINDIFISGFRDRDLIIYKDKSKSPNNICWVYGADKNIVIYHGNNGPELFDADTLLKDIDAHLVHSELIWKRKFSFPVTE